MAVEAESKSITQPGNTELMKGNRFKVEGGARLSGSIEPQGAKNEALQILCAVLLTDQDVTIHNLPNIRDVNKLIDTLKELGVISKKAE